MWTLAKSQTNICQIRLDFDESSISQPSNAAGVAGDCSTVDNFRVGLKSSILVFYLLLILTGHSCYGKAHPLYVWRKCWRAHVY